MNGKINFYKILKRCGGYEMPILWLNELRWHEVGGTIDEISQ